MAEDGANREDTSEGASALRVGHEREGAVCRVTAAGDVDLATVPRLREAVERAVTGAESPSTLEIDLRGVEFMDSAGLALFVEVRNRYGAEAPVTLLVRQRSQPERILRLGHFEQFFRVEFMPPDTV